MNLRVLDLSERLGPSYGTKLLADFGAHVVKIERPGEGDPVRDLPPFKDARADVERSASFLYLNTNKKSVTLNLESQAGREILCRLIPRFDVVVESAGPAIMERWGISPSEFVGDNPALSWISCSSFGLSGPYAGYQADNLVLGAMGGWMYQLGELGRQPLMPGSELAAASVPGLYVAIAALAATLGESRKGGLIEVCELEAYLSATRYFETTYTMSGRVIQRSGSGSRPSYRMVRCKDGWGFLSVFNQSQWELMVDLMELRPALEEHGFDYVANFGQEGQDNTWIDELINEWCSQRTKDEVFETCQGWRVPFGKVNDPAEVFSMEQLAHRRFFAEAQHPVVGKIIYPGHPFEAPSLDWQAGRAPLLGEHTTEILSAELGITPDSDLFKESQRQDSSVGAAWPARTAPSTPSNQAVEATALPLAGLRVFDLSTIWAGPMAAAVLADLGADVIKVESIQRPEYWRTLLSDFKDAEWWETGPLFHAIQRNRRDVTLNLMEPEGKALMERLVQGADVLIENYSPRVMPQFGLGYPELSSINPALVMVSCSGFGDQGPIRDYLSTASVGDALSGLSHVSGYADGPPLYFGGQNSDPITGLHGAVGALLALHHRRETGEGQRISVAQLETTVAVAGEVILEYTLNGTTRQRAGNDHSASSPHDTFPTGGGQDEWIAISVRDQEAWDALCAVIGQPGLATDTRFCDETCRQENRAELAALIGSWTKTLPRDAIFEQLQAAGVAAGPVLGPVETLADPHLGQRDYLTMVATPQGIDQPVPRTPIRFNGRVLPIRRRAPRLGEHNHEILIGELHLEASHYETLEQRQIIGTRPLGQ